MSGARRVEQCPDQRRTGLPALAVAVAVLLGATGGLGTLAYWNDVETLSGATVTAGSLDLVVRDGGGVAVDRWDQLTLANMAPGESVAATLTVRNAGTTPFTVGVNAAGSGGLLAAVDVALVAGVAPTLPTPYPRTQTCSGAVDKGLRDSPSWTVPGTIPPGGSVQLCVRLSLRASADNTLQGQAVVPTFTLTATQAQS